MDAGRSKCWKMAHSYTKNIVLQLIVCIVSLTSCVWYVLNTYGIPQSEIVYIIVDSFFFVVFLVDYVLFVTASGPYYTDFICSFDGFIDFLSLLPIIAVFFPEEDKYYPFAWLGFVRFFRLISLLKFISLRQTVKPGAQPFDSVVAIQVNDLVFTVLQLVIYLNTFLFLATGLVYAVSHAQPTAFLNRNMMVVDVNGDPIDSELTWFESFYFTIVTITTVGYGDITPNLWYAKLVVICIILTAFILLPAQITRVLQMVLFRPLYLGEYVPQSHHKHIVITGILDYELLNRCLCEFFHPSHNPPEYSKCKFVVVILSPLKPTVQVDFLIKSQFKNRVEYYIGSAKSPADLNRVNLATALAVYIISDVTTRSLRQEEDSIFLSVILIHKFLNEKSIISRIKRKAICAVKPPLILAKLTSSAKTKHVLRHLGTDVIVNVQELKYTLLALGSIYPGFLSLFINLNRARSYSQKIMAAAKRKATTRRAGPGPAWQPDYYESTRYSIIQINMRNHILREFESSVIPSVLFQAAVLSLYEISSGKVMLVAVKHDNKVYVNPMQGGCADINITECQDLFCLTDNWTDAQECIKEMLRFDTCSTGGNEISDIIDLSQFELHASKTSASEWSQVEVTAEEKVDASLLDVSSGHPSELMTPTSILLSPYSTLLATDDRKNNNKTQEELRWGRFETNIPLLLSKLVNHVVLVVSSFASINTNVVQDDIVSANSLMLPIIYYCKTVRRHSSDHIVILCEKATDIGALCKEINLTNPEIFQNVHFYEGTGRSLEHLIACRVTYARAVVIIRSPVVNEAFEEALEPTSFATINADRHTIIISLNIHLLLSDKIKKRVAAPVTARKSDLPFTICEIVHESNICFLRQSYFATTKRKTTTNGSRDYETVLLHSNAFHENDDVKADDYITHREIEFDFPLIAAGSLLPHSLLDSLIIQNIFNPDLLNFWEALLKCGDKGKCKNYVPNNGSSSAHSSDTMGDLAQADYFENQESSIAGVSVDGNQGNDSGYESDHSSDVEHVQESAFDRLHGNNHDFPAFEAKACNENNGKKRVEACKIMKIDVPAFCIGRSFQQLFKALVTHKKCVPIAIFRFPTEDQIVHKANLPFTLCVPTPTSILQERDEIFIVI